LKAIAGSQFVVYQNAGHALHWEEPERFAADLAALARSVGG
jgi:non-heme chloroperoxidase